MQNLNVDAVKHLKDVYGLEPGDIDLQDFHTVEDVKAIAKKFGLTKRSEMTLEKASLILKRFQPPRK